MLNTKIKPEEIPKVTVQLPTAAFGSAQAELSEKALKRNTINNELIEPQNCKQLHTNSFILSMCSAAVGGLQLKLTGPEIKETPDLHKVGKGPHETMTLTMWGAFLQAACWLSLTGQARFLEIYHTSLYLRVGHHYRGHCLCSEKFSARS